LTKCIYSKSEERRKKQRKSKNKMGRKKTNKNWEIKKEIK